MLKKVKETIYNHQMIADEEGIVVGVSGGADSMVLLDILSKAITNKLIVAHLNHKFREEDAEKDAEFVKSESTKRGIDAEIAEYDVKKYMQETGLGAQEAARKIRYRFYLEVAKKHNATYIALGHHANDQAETVLMRILRGTGIRGLAGIPYVRDFAGVKIIRPLLDVTRQEIEEYSENNCIIYRTDQSNYSTKYTRNKIRLSILPYLEQYNLQLVSHLHSLAKVTQDEDRLLESFAVNFLEDNNCFREQKVFILEIYKLQKLDIALQRRVIHLILTYLNLKEELSFIHIEEILKLTKNIHPAKSLDLPGARVYRNYQELIFKSIKNITNKKNTHYQYKLTIPGELIIPEANKKIEIFVMDYFFKPKGDWAVFDLERLQDQDLSFRSRKDGDRIEVKGMEGSKKVKDIFIDKKIPRDKRESIPILTEGSDKILWILGITRAKHALVSETTKSFLYVVCSDL